MMDIHPVSYLLSTGNGGEFDHSVENSMLLAILRSLRGLVHAQMPSCCQSPIVGLLQGYV